MIVPTPRVTDPPKGPPQKKRSQKFGGSLAKLGVRTPDPPVVAPLPGGRLDTKLSTIHRKWSCPESLTQCPLIVRVESNSDRRDGLHYKSCSIGYTSVLPTEMNLNSCFAVCCVRINQYCTEFQLTFQYKIYSICSKIVGSRGPHWVSLRRSPDPLVESLGAPLTCVAPETVPDSCPRNMVTLHE